MDSMCSLLATNALAQSLYTLRRTLSHVVNACVMGTHYFSLNITFSTSSWMVAVLLALILPASLFFFSKCCLARSANFHLPALSIDTHEIRIRGDGTVPRYRFESKASQRICHATTPFLHELNFGALATCRYPPVRECCRPS